MKYLVTGAAGFIGNFVAQRLCEQGHQDVGLDLADREGMATEVYAD